MRAMQIRRNKVGADAPRRTWVLPVAGGVLAAGVLVATNEPGDAAFAAPLTSAVAACDIRPGIFTDVTDRGHTLSIDGEGEEDTGVDIDGVACLLAQLDVPSAVVDRMDHTRALDGMQDAEWGDYAAAWTYHPDDGLDVTVTWGDG